MRLERRVDRLEKNREKHDELLAFIGVPKTAIDVFKEADNFWNEEKGQHSLDNVRGAVPWPSYSGDQVKFLGFGTYDDLYFGLCGGVRDHKRLRFLFLGDVEHLIKDHWKEVQMFVNTHKENRDDLVVSEEAAEIISFMCKCK